MPFAGAHVIIVIAVLAVLRKFLKLKISNRLLLFGGVLGLLPDIDIPIALGINWIFGTSLYFHKIYTHAVIIPLLLFLIAIIMKKFSRFSTIIFITAIAWFVHLVLDCYFAIGKAPSFLPGGPGLGFCNELLSLSALLNADAIVIVLGVLYLAYRSGKKKV